MSKTKTATKTQPMRTCIVSREKLPKAQLMRLVRVTDESGKQVVKVDPFNKLKGRGANLKPDSALLDQAFRIGAIERALQLETKLTPEEQASLKIDFEEAIAEKQFRSKGKHVQFKVTREVFDQALANN